ncbi:hypothetical protein A1F94_004107 [Pyrenophora tritici-repentis]|nr:hypothetical protein A1F94_004107 [Pyrenophora tritici-repentis]
MASNSSIPTPVPFPQPEGIRNPNPSSPVAESPSTNPRARTSTGASSISSKIRTATGKLIEANPPPGMWAATGTTAARAPSISDIRRGSFGSTGWCEETQRRRAGSRTSQGEDSTNVELAERSSAQRRTSSGNVLDGEPFPALAEEDTREAAGYDGQKDSLTSGMRSNHSSETVGEHLDNAQQPKRTASGHVCLPMFPLRQHTNAAIVRQRLYTTTQAAMETVIRHRFPGLLQVVLDPPAVSSLLSMV